MNFKVLNKKINYSKESIAYNTNYSNTQFKLNLISIQSQNVFKFNIFYKFRKYHILLCFWFFHPFHPSVTHQVRVGGIFHSIICGENSNLNASCRRLATIHVRAVPNMVGGNHLGTRAISSAALDRHADRHWLMRISRVPSPVHHRPSHQTRVLPARRACSFGAQVGRSHNLINARPELRTKTERTIKNCQRK